MSISADFIIFEQHCHGIQFRASNGAFLKEQPNLVWTAGQQGSSYPSSKRNERDPASAPGRAPEKLINDPSTGNTTRKIYFVGVAGGLGIKAYTGGTQPGIQMRQFYRTGDGSINSTTVWPNVGYTINTRITKN